MLLKLGVGPDRVVVKPGRTPEGGALHRLDWPAYARLNRTIVTSLLETVQNSIAEIFPLQHKNKPLAER